MKKMIKPHSILLVDDHEIVRMGLRALLEKNQKFQIIGEAENGQEAVERYKELGPDITLMDIRMPIMNGIDACREIRDIDGKAKVLMLTSHADDEAMFASIMAGSIGYVKKQISFDDLVHSIEQALTGVQLLDHIETVKLIERAQQNMKEKQLNAQEVEILNLIGEGLTNREIGDALCLSEKTVRNYVSNIFAKLNFTNRSQAAVYAVKKNMFDKM